MSVPARFQLQRWDGQQWVRVADLRPQDDVPDQLASGRASAPLTLSLPLDVAPGWHRVVVAGRTSTAETVEQFFYEGDPNR
jgi:hypothetical protein